MKLVAMKLACLLSLALGLIALATLLGAFNPAVLPALYEKHVPPNVVEVINFTYAEEIVALVLVVFSFYGLLPKFGSKKKHRAVAFSGDHGDVIVHLDMVESTLTRVLSNMPEVKKIKVHVQSDGKGRKATIVADCVLNDRPEVPARQAADAVNEYLSEAAGNILGVEDIASVKLNIVGVEVNPKASSLYLEAAHAERVKALEVKRLPQAPGLAPGARALPEADEVVPVMPLVPSQNTSDFDETPVAPVVENASNVGTADYGVSENEEPSLSTGFDALNDEEEEKKKDA